MTYRITSWILLALLSFGWVAQAQESPAVTPLLAAETSDTQSTGDTSLSFTTNQVAAAQLTARFLTRFHYESVPLDDDMSKQIFEQYLKALDGSRLFFTQDDIDDMARYELALDDAIIDGDLSVPFAIFNLYVQRSTERYQHALSLLDETLDFSGKETFELNRKHAEWPADTVTSEDLWRRRVMNDWLRLKLAGQDDDKIRDVLKKRYDGYIKRVKQLDTEDAFQIFMDAYARSTDPHTDYFGPRQAENFDISMRLSLEGIGAVLQVDGDYTQIREVIPGGPADKSGKIEAGDRIVAVGQGADKDEPMEDILGWRLNDVVSKIRGKKGTSVRLEIIPSKAGLDGEHKVVTLERDKVAIKEQAAKKKVIEVAHKDDTYRIGIIDLPSFYEDFAAHQAGEEDFRSASRDVAGLLGELKEEGVDGVVVDLRNNGGGSLTEAIKLTGLFIDQGPVVQVRQSNGAIDVNADQDPGMAWSGPLAVLISRGSASASEIFAGAIQDYGRGIILGNASFGKGTVQNLVNLDRFSDPPHKKPTFGEIKMTIAKFFRINGDSTQVRGVEPDIEFPHSGDAEEYGESTYDNALPWTAVDNAPYEPVADPATIIPLLEKRHEKRVADSPAWKLMLDELEFTRANRDRTVVSLNYEKRKAQREDMEAQEKRFKERHKEIDGEESDSLSVQLDDGLQYSERSLEQQLADEKKAKDSPDVPLTEAANILADAAILERNDHGWAEAVLPYKGKFAPRKK